MGFASVLAAFEPLAHAVENASVCAVRVVLWFVHQQSDAVQVFMCSDVQNAQNASEKVMSNRYALKPKKIGNRLMDAKRQDAIRQHQRANSKVNEVYQAHLRCGGTPLSFAEECVKRAREEIMRARERAAQDITYMLCRTAERVIPRWPDEFTAIVLEDQEQVDRWQLHRRKMNEGNYKELRKGIENSSISGQVTTMHGAVIDPDSHPLMGANIILYTEGIVNCWQDLFGNGPIQAVVNKEYWPQDEILENYQRYITRLHAIGIQQHAKLAIGDLERILNYFGPNAIEGCELNCKNGVPICIGKDRQDGREMIAILRDSSLEFFTCENDRLDWYHETGDRRNYTVVSVSPEHVYDRALDAIRFEKGRRERGEPAGALIQYLRQRDLK